MQIGIAVSTLQCMVNVYMMTLFRHRALMSFDITTHAIIYLIMGVAASCLQSEKSLLAIVIVMHFTYLALSNDWIKCLLIG